MIEAYFSGFASYKKAMYGGGKVETASHDDIDEVSDEDQIALMRNLGVL